MRLDRIKEMKKSEVRPYFQSLAGITPYVEAAIAVDCFGIAAAPVDTKLLLWLISKDALPEGTDIKTAQQAIERHLKSGEPPVDGAFPQEAKAMKVAAPQEVKKPPVPAKAEAARKPAAAKKK